MVVVRVLHVKGEGKFKVTFFHCETFIPVTTSEFVSFENCFIDTLFMGEFLKWQLFALGCAKKMTDFTWNFTSLVINCCCNASILQKNIAMHLYYKQILVYLPHFLMSLKSA